MKLIQSIGIYIILCGLIFQDQMNNINPLIIYVIVGLGGTLFIGGSDV